MISYELINYCELDRFAAKAYSLGYFDIARGNKYKYKEYHKYINGVLYKKCTLHNEFFPDESPWLCGRIVGKQIILKTKPDKRNVGIGLPYGVNLNLFKKVINCFID